MTQVQMDLLPVLPVKMTRNVSSSSQNMNGDNSINLKKAFRLTQQSFSDDEGDISTKQDSAMVIQSARDADGTNSDENMSDTFAKDMDFGEYIQEELKKNPIKEVDQQIPKRYMTAADFEKVCAQLNSISSSYDKSAQRYEACIE